MKSAALILSFLFYLIISGSNAQELYFPQINSEAWETSSPTELEWDTDYIDSLYQYLKINHSKAFILLEGGKIVLEWYFDQFTTDSIWYWASAGKGMTAFLTGVLQGEGLLDINNPTQNYLGEGWTYSPVEKEALITIRDQLSMVTGLNDEYSDRDCTIDSCLQYLTEPGKRWAYYNAPYTLITNVLEEASGLNLNLLLINRLRNSTGISGAYIPLGFNRVVFSRPRSFARFGLLMLAGGNWDGNAILNDREYFDQMISSSQELNQSYGYLWWLNGQESFMIPQFQWIFNGPLLPDAPSDSYSALGLNGQILNITPSENLVFIRMGNNPGGPNVPYSMNNDIWQYINKIKSPTSIDQQLKYAPFTIYPNPARDYLKVTIPKNSQSVQLKLYCSKGHLVKTTNESKLELDNLNPGNYFLEITVNNLRLTEKVVILR